MRSVTVGPLVVFACACTLQHHKHVTGDDEDAGGSSGVANSRGVTTLSPAEELALCNELSQAFPTREITCNGEAQSWGFDVDCSTTDLFGSECTATVGEYRDCLDALASLNDTQACMLASNPPACTPIEGC
ncbi:MAG TPA: hypothetical protein VGM90_15950 [Kofleriaceae bacterium]|jgi:hypothetical protein